MSNNTEAMQRQLRTMLMVKGYPIAVLLVSVVLNGFVFGIGQIDVSLPSTECVHALIIAAALLIINHTWLMTSTELTRVRFNLFATPEERSASGTSQEDAPEEGLQELDRRHNAHRNTTENTIYFILLAFIFVLVSPTTVAAQVWIIGYSLARLGFTFSYLTGRNSARGLFMTLSLLPVYGMASYLVMSFTT